SGISLPSPDLCNSALSRQVGVIRKQSLVINLPGQPKSINETLGGLKDEHGNC
ncbi:molybdopterin adenylyltransferase domain protein, partial [Candidatus Erwinia dacicola]